MTRYAKMVVLNSKNDQGWCLTTGCALMHKYIKPRPATMPRNDSQIIAVFAIYALLPITFALFLYFIVNVYIE